jgi:hypothetical protein
VVAQLASTGVAARDHHIAGNVDSFHVLSIMQYACAVAMIAQQRQTLSAPVAVGRILIVGATNDLNSEAVGILMTRDSSGLIARDRVTAGTPLMGVR